MFDLDAVQQSLREFASTAGCCTTSAAATSWRSRVLGLDQKPPGSRRFFYFVPAKGEPRKAGAPDRDGGARRHARREVVLSSLARAGSRSQPFLQGSRRVAMEYALGFPTRMSRESTPARSSSFAVVGVEVVSSGDLIQRFEATWDDDQWQMHLEAEKVTKCRISTWLSG